MVQERIAIHRLVVSAEEHGMDLDDPKLGGCQLDAAIFKDIENIKAEWAHVLTDKPGDTQVTEHVINTGEARPIRSQPYLISPTKLDGVKKEINSLLELVIIAPSTSPWSSPMVPIIKPDKSIRLCIDYRKVSNVMVSDPYYIPTVDELIGKMGKAKFLTKLDLAKGFYQVPVNPEFQDRTAFVTPWGKFCFLRMPYGLRNAPTMFQHLMDMVLAELEGYAVPYIDDILISSESWDVHLQHVRTVMGRLSNAKLTAKPAKCEWGKMFVNYLSHKVGDGHVSFPDARVASIREYVFLKMKDQLNHS